MTTTHSRSVLVAAAGAGAIAIASLAAACADDATGPGESGTTEITVYAAASLTSTFTEIAEEFETANPGVIVRLNFGGSADLVAQIQEGAPAEVFASADEANMDKLAASQAQEARAFATNSLQIAVPPGNPADVASFDDLATPGLNLVVCAPQVPCGAAAQRAAREAGVRLAPVSEEQSVTDVLAKVTSGEADAGLVYLTDVRAAGESVEGVETPEAAAVVNTYPITVLLSSTSSRERQVAAADFVDFVLGPEGRAVLERAGFGPP
jgi:molybdate transport system substrate-binding protein